jgi:putative Mg2+ transporter-C (MgtC) family protein
MSLATSIPTLPWVHALARLALAAGLGAAIGLERELRERQAGLRTHLLVALGAALFTIVSAFGFHDVLTNSSHPVALDPSRIAAQIVTGVGFLGAGAIIRQGISVRGLTTAATLWVVAAIGMACGAGLYTLAITATVVALLALWPLRFIAYHAIEAVKPVGNQLVVELAPGEPLGPLLDEVPHARHIEVDDEDERRIVLLELPEVDEQLVARIIDLDYVLGVRWRR